MSSDRTAKQPSRLTMRGAATRERIVSAAAELIYANGVGATSLDDVMVASGTGKSQMYHYFADKEALIGEVVSVQIGRLLSAQEPLLRRVDSVRGLEKWRDAEVIDNRTRRGAHGCPLGSLASALADHSESVRQQLVEGFAAWEAYLADGLRRMRDKGELASDADPEELAAGILAALQGGMLLAQTARDPRRLEAALDMALACVRAHVPAVPPPS